MRKWLMIILPHISLVVLRVFDIGRVEAFYRLLGIEFTKRAHGAGPEHYSAELNGVVFELYPASPEQPVSSSARIGLVAADVDEMVEQLAVIGGAKIIMPPQNSEWRRRAVVADPDGHRERPVVAKLPEKIEALEERTILRCRTESLRWSYALNVPPATTGYPRWGRRSSIHPLRYRNQRKVLDKRA